MYFFCSNPVSPLSSFICTLEMYSITPKTVVDTDSHIPFLEEFLVGHVATQKTFPSLL